MKKPTSTRKASPPPAGRTPTQEEMLGKYTPSQETNLDLLGPGDFAILGMVGVE